MRRNCGGPACRGAWTPTTGPGIPACLLPRVCQACGDVAETDPPVTCPQCGAEIPAD